MDKINILTLGGCAAADILKSNRNHVSLYNIDMWLGSFSRQMWEPGKVANRLKEEIETIVGSASTNQDDFVSTVMQIYYVVKERRTPSILLKDLPDNSVVIIDPAYEIQRFYFDGNEIFDLHSNYDKHVRKHMPAWFNDLVFKYYTPYDSGIIEIAKFQYRALDKFLLQLKKLNVPVIAINNLYTSKIYDPTTNSAVRSIPHYNSKIPFSKLHSSDLEKYDYSTDLINRFYEIWEDRLPKEFKLFSPDLNEIYADSDHYLGYHPTHLHHTCRTTLNAELTATIIDAIAEHKARQTIIMPGNKDFII